LLIDNALLHFCATKTKEIIKFYQEACAWPHELRRSVDDLGLIVSGKHGREIYYRKLPISAKANLVRGFYIPKGDQYLIFFVSDLSDEMLRYVKCKELFQIILDTEALRTVDIIELVRNMILRSSPESADLNLGHTTNSETIAEIAAWEFLFPYKDRVALKGTVNGKDDYAKLASDYGMPQYMIERCLSDEMMTALGPFFG
jgi:Zn-dependent peptidase ImmA (M78 family)